MNASEVEKCIDDFGTDIYRFCLKLCADNADAEDLYQQTFLKALERLDNYDHSCKLSTWLCQIAKHLWYQQLDKYSRRNEVELTDEIPNKESPEQATLLHMEKTELYQAIHRLPEPMRELMYLRLTGEFSFSEIGSLLGKSENWARTTFYRAKQKIIKEMEGST